MLDINNHIHLTYIVKQVKLHQLDVRMSPNLANKRNTDFLRTADGTITK